MTRITPLIGLFLSVNKNTYLFWPINAHLLLSINTHLPLSGWYTFFFLMDISLAFSYLLTYSSLNGNPPDVLRSRETISRLYNLYCWSGLSRRPKDWVRFYDNSQILSPSILVWDGPFLLCSMLKYSDWTETSCDDWWLINRFSRQYVGYIAGMVSAVSLKTGPLPYNS